MPTLNIADFQSQTRISESVFARLESEGRIRLSLGQRAAIGQALKEYEFLRVLQKAGEGATLKKMLLKLQASTEKFIESIQAVSNEPGHIWEYLLGESSAEVSRLRFLLAKCKELNRRIARPGPKKNFFLDSLLSRLAAIYLQAGGRGTTSKDGPFLRFAFEASKCLPQRFRPHSKGALGVRWGRVRNTQKKSQGRVHMWVGGPYPALAKPWFGKTKL
jgi:hypothetical protein